MLLTSLAVARSLRDSNKESGSSFHTIAPVKASTSSHMIEAQKSSKIYGSMTSNSFAVALAKKGVDVKAILEKPLLVMKNTSDQQYFADLNGHRVLYGPNLCFPRLSA